MRSSGVAGFSIGVVVRYWFFRTFWGGAVSVAGTIDAGVQAYFGVADSSTGVSVLCRFSKFPWVAVSVKGTIW